MRKNNIGISLIVLVITILVIIILTGALILNLVNNNPILQVEKATFLNDIRSFQNELSLYIVEQFSDSLGQYDSNLLQADDISVTYNTKVNNNITIKDLIKSLGKTDKYNGKLMVINGELVFGGSNTNEIEWAEEIDVTLDSIAPQSPILTASTTEFTNQDVLVTIIYSFDSNIKEYSLDSTTWNVYTSPIVIDTNDTIIYARSIDIAGNISEQSTLTVTNIDRVMPSITNYAGSMLYSDPNFQSGVNSTYVYNNLGNGTVTRTRIAMNESPTGSGYGLEIKTAGTSTPGWGGFYFATASAANKIFITRIIANIPVGYNINWTSNLYGTGGTLQWLTSKLGTGKWEEYICKVTCGASGTFSSTNFYYLLGGVTPTIENPLIWKVAYATVFDITKWNTTNSIYTFATDTSGIAAYGINQSNTIAPTFTNVTANTNFATSFNDIMYNGTYYVWLKDQAGNITNSPVIVSYIDTLAPEVVASNNGTTISSIDVKATASDLGGSGLKINSYQFSKDNGVTWTTAGSATTYNFTGLTTGTYQCKVRVADNVGNVTTSLAVSITTQ